MISHKAIHANPKTTLVATSTVAIETAARERRDMSNARGIYWH